jgi:hypothetical protein
MLDELLNKLQNIEQSVGYTLIEPAQNADIERLKEWISKIFK